MFLFRVFHVNLAPAAGSVTVVVMCHVFALRTGTVFFVPMINVAVTQTSGAVFVLLVPHPGRGHCGGTEGGYG